MKERNIVTCILLTIVTCGIYSFIWFVEMTDDVVFLNKGKEYSTSGGKALLFTILTCGIYGLYWYYKVGKALYLTKVEKGIHASDNSILYLILAIFGLGIVSYCLIQSELNEFARQ